MTPHGDGKTSNRWKPAPGYSRKEEEEEAKPDLSTWQGV
jgi:hypothetical protein